MQLRGNGEKRQISYSIAHESHRLIFVEAARQKIPMCQLIEKWIDPHIQKLKRAKK